MRPILFILLLSSSLLSAQPYIPMLDQDYQWSNVYSDYWGDGYTSWQYTLDNPTDINGLFYYPVLTEGEASGCFLREEDGRVYLYDSGATEYLVLDFNLEIGDTFENVGQYCDVFFNGSTIDFLEVIDIYDDFIADENRKVIQFQAYDGPGSPMSLEEYDEKWIEGIGSTKGILPFYHNWDFYCDLACFKVEGVTYHFNGFVSCVYTADIEDFDKPSMVFYPNPVEALGTIVFPPTMVAEKVAFYDLNGKKLGEYPLSGNSTTFDFSNWGSGLYFYEIQNSDGKKVSAPFVVK